MSAPAAARPCVRCDHDTANDKVPLSIVIGDQRFNACKQCMDAWLNIQDAPRSISVKPGQFVTTFGGPIVTYSTDPATGNHTMKMTFDPPPKLELLPTAAAGTKKND